MSAGAAEPAAAAHESAAARLDELVPRGVRRVLPMLRVLLLGILGVAAVSLWVAQRPAGVPASFSASVAPTDLASFLSWGVPVEMEENDRVINVRPLVSIDPLGGFLVADAAEAQLRRYRPDGALARVTGRKGRGPGEFRNLSAVQRLPDGRIAAVEMGGKVSVFDAEGEKLLFARQAPVAPLYDADVLDARHLLLAGRRVGTGGTSLVHVYDLETGAVTRAFMDIPHHDPALAAGYAFAGTVDAVARGDTVAAVFALCDSIYLFDARTGRDLGRIAIPFRHFRRLTRPMPPSGSPIAAFRAWGETFSAISHLHWLRDGSFVVQYYDVHGAEPGWRLVRLARDGRLRFEGMDTPKLLAAGGPADELVFVHPAADAPNVWVTARLRP